MRRSYRYTIFVITTITGLALSVAIEQVVTETQPILDFLVANWVWLFLVFILTLLLEQLAQEIRELPSTRISLGRRIRLLVCGYRSQYLEYLREATKYAKMPGRLSKSESLTLKDIYVKLSLIHRAIYESRPNIIESSPKSNHRQLIWYFLEAHPKSRKRFLIIGQPGGGKTTLLRHIAQVQSLAREDRRKITLYHRLPLLIQLIKVGEALGSDKNASLADVVAMTLPGSHDESLHPTNRWFRTQLTKGSCVVLLDGLDEVAGEENRRDVLDWVARQRSHYNRHDFIITSRPSETLAAHQPEGFTSLKVCEFSSEDQNEFIDKWFRVYESQQSRASFAKDPRGKTDVSSSVKRLKERIFKNDHTLAGFAVNPLLLMMICFLHDKLPHVTHRKDLYKYICDILLDERARGDSLGLNLRQKRFILQALAFEMTIQNKNTLPREEAAKYLSQIIDKLDINLDPQEFLTHIAEESSSLFNSDTNEIFTFIHTTVREFLTAWHIRLENLENVLFDRLSDDAWQGTASFYLAIAPDSTKVKVIEKCLSDQHLSSQTLALALDYRDQQQKSADNTVINKIDDVISKGLQHPNERRRHETAQALLRWRLQSATRRLDERSIGLFLVEHAVYLWFMDQKGVLKYKPDHWKNTQLPSYATALTPIVGVRPEDAQAFCNWLTLRDPYGWQYRLPCEKDELDPIDPQQWRQGRLNKNFGYWFQQGQNFKLRRGSDHPWPLSLTQLHQHLQRDIKWVSATRMNKPEVVRKLPRVFSYMPPAIDLDQALRQIMTVIDNTPPRILSSLLTLPDFLKSAKFLHRRVQKDQHAAEHERAQIDRELKTTTLSRKQHAERLDGQLQQIIVDLQSLATSIPAIFLKHVPQLKNLLYQKREIIDIHLKYLKQEIEKLHYQVHQSGLKLTKLQDEIADLEAEQNKTMAETPERLNSPVPNPGNARIPSVPNPGNARIPSVPNPGNARIPSVPNQSLPSQTPMVNPLMYKKQTEIVEATRSKQNYETRHTDKKNKLEWLEEIHERLGKNYEHIVELASEAETQHTDLDTALQCLRRIVAVCNSGNSLPFADVESASSVITTWANLLSDLYTSLGNIRHDELKIILYQMKHLRLHWPWSVTAQASLKELAYQRRRMKDIQRCWKSTHAELRSYEQNLRSIDDLQKKSDTVRQYLSWSEVACTNLDALVFHLDKQVRDRSYLFQAEQPLWIELRLSTLSFALALAQDGYNQFHPDKQALLQECLNLYAGLVIFDERVRGNLPAIEGIRIVREQSE